MDTSEEPKVFIYPKFSSLPRSFQYSSSLNSIIAVNNENQIEVLDIHLGQFSASEQLKKPEGQYQKIFAVYVEFIVICALGKPARQ